MNTRFLIPGSVILAFTLACSLQAQHSAVKAAPRFDKGWQDRAKILDERVKDGQDAELLFIGDSITQGWEGDGAKEVWAKYYDKRKAVNIGIGGDRTQHVLWRLENAPFGDMKPKAAVVMIGTNNSNFEDNTPGQIAEGVAAIVKKLRERLPKTKILLLGIFPRGENFNPQRGKVAQVNQVLAKLDDGRNVHYLDIGHRFLTSDGILPAEIMPDFLHLSKSGYEIWAEAIEPKLAQLMGEKK
jgi:lysophospholipase L1-like esterase